MVYGIWHMSSGVGAREGSAPSPTSTIPSRSTSLRVIYDRFGAWYPLDGTSTFWEEGLVDHEAKGFSFLWTSNCTTGTHWDIHSLISRQLVGSTLVDSIGLSYGSGTGSMRADLLDRRSYHLGCGTDLSIVFCIATGIDPYIAPLLILIE